MSPFVQRSRVELRAVRPPKSTKVRRVGNRLVSAHQLFHRYLQTSTGAVVRTVVIRVRGLVAHAGCGIRRPPASTAWCQVWIFLGLAPRIVHWHPLLFAQVGVRVDTGGETPMEQAAKVVTAGRVSDAMLRYLPVRNPPMSPKALPYLCLPFPTKPRASPTSPASPSPAGCSACSCGIHWGRSTRRPWPPRPDLDAALLPAPAPAPPHTPPPDAVTGFRRRCRSMRHVMPTLTRSL